MGVYILLDDKFGQYTFGLVDMERYFWEYKALHNELFRGSDISAAWIDWWFDTVHEGKIRIYGAFDELQTLVGIWGVEPRKLCVDNIVIDVGRCFAVGIQKAHRRKGLFKALSKFALVSEKALNQYEYIVGFPQRGRVVTSGHLKAGWYIVKDIDVYKLDADNLPECHTESDQFCDVDPSYDVFIRRVYAHSYKKREGDFYGWQHTRWIGHPQTHYIPLVLRETSEGYGVLKQYSNWAHVVALEGPDSAHLLNVAVSLCKQHGWCELSLWCSDNQPNKNVIEAAGFTKTEEAVHIIAYNIRADIDLKLPLCNIQMGIEETY